MVVLRLLMLLSTVQPLIAFIFGTSPDQDFCYQLDLENCFREAFLEIDADLAQARSKKSVMQPPIRRLRDVPFFHSGNVTVLDRRRSGLKHLMLCHDVRRFNICFNFPGCSDQMAAHIASVQYHMVFGKKLPIQVFLSYRGFGKQMCEQECSRELLSSCRSVMSTQEMADEEALMGDVIHISEHITGGGDGRDQCDKFKEALIQVMRYRSQYCGETAKCTCMETSIRKGLSYCNVGCENLLNPTGHAGSNTIILSVITCLIIFVNLLV